jgi:hypothetical protein
LQGLLQRQKDHENIARIVCLKTGFFPPSHVAKRRTISLDLRRAQRTVLVSLFGIILITTMSPEM